MMEQPRTCHGGFPTEFPPKDQISGTVKLSDKEWFDKKNLC